MSFQAFDGINYPVSDESVDLIVTRYAFEKDDDGIIDRFMRVKKDGHIQFYSSNELDQLFADNGFAKEKQVITDMKFPFAKQAEYIELYDQITEKEKSLYDMTNDNGVIWVKYINVGNTVFVKQN